MNASARGNAKRAANQTLKALLLSGAACFIIGAAWGADAPAGQIDPSKVVDVSATKIAQSAKAAQDKKAPEDKKAAGKKAAKGAAAGSDDGDAGDKSLAKNTAGNRSNNPTGGASSLVVAAGTSPLTNNIRVRGVGANTQTMSVEQDVQVAVDGVVLLRGIERTMTSYADYADLAGGAVLYGPQGTLFSKNALAGAVNIATLAPTSQLTAKAEFGMGEAGEYHEKGTISGALSDTVSARLSGFLNNVPGFVHNVMTGNDDNNSNSWGANTKVQWKATDDLGLTFSVWYRNDHTTCCSMVPVEINNPLLLGLYSQQGIPGIEAGKPFSAKRYSYDTTNGTTFGSQSGVFSVRGEYDLGSAKLTSVSAYQFRMVDNWADRDNIYNTVPIYTGGNGGNYYALWNDYTNRLRTQQWSQDVRISSADKSSRFNYEVGFYWYHFNMSQEQHDRAAYCKAGTLGQACATANTSWKSRQATANEVNDGYALFGELQYALTNDLKLFGGPRVMYEYVSMDGICGLPMPDHPTDKPFGTCTSGYKEAGDLSASGDAGIRYDFGWGNVYGKVARGYKGQAYNMGTKTDYAHQDVVQPEYNLAFELGFGAKTPDKKYSINAVVFQTNFDNMQVSASRANVTTGSIDNIVVNAGTARSRGFELSLQEAPFQGFSINESITFTEATFNLVGNSCPIQWQSTSAYGCYQNAGESTWYKDNKGGQFPFSPKWKVSVAPRYQHGIPGTDYKAFIQAAVNFQSRQTFDLGQDPALFQKGYTVVNTSFGLSDKDNRYQLTFAVNNVFNQLFYTNMSHFTLDQTASSYNDYLAQIPRAARRQFSARISANF
jgi:iron complex outermembrane receptor protein